jgi:hypothetical protein
VIVCTSRNHCWNLYRELRSSTTLAELLAKRDQRDAARELLAPIYNWFAEGFDTKDLVAARKLLEATRRRR